MVRWMARAGNWSPPGGSAAGHAARREPGEPKGAFPRTVAAMTDSSDTAARHPVVCGLPAVTAPPAHRGRHRFPGAAWTSPAAAHVSSLLRDRIRRATHQPPALSATRPASAIHSKAEPESRSAPPRAT